MFAKTGDMPPGVPAGHSRPRRQRSTRINRITRLSPIRCSGPATPATRCRRSPGCLQPLSCLCIPTASASIRSSEPVAEPQELRLVGQKSSPPPPFGQSCPPARLSGRVPPSGLYTRLDGVARARARARASARRPSKPCAYACHVTPSTPAAASFFSTKAQGSTVTWCRSDVRRSRGSRSTNCRIRPLAWSFPSPVPGGALSVRIPLGTVLRSIGRSRGSFVRRLHRFPCLTAHRTSSADSSSPSRSHYRPGGTQISQVPAIRTCPGSHPAPPSVVGCWTERLDIPDIPGPICQRLTPGLAERAGWRRLASCYDVEACGVRSLTFRPAWSLSLLPT